MLVSLILCVKDGMPYLPEAIESVLAQTYDDFEVVVQDACSTDGSTEFLWSLDDERFDVVSEPDGGIGDAYNRAVRRCSGELVGSIDADNVLAVDALAAAVEYAQVHPAVAAFYGGVTLLGEGGEVVDSWAPPAFDLLALLECRLVPPFGQSFFSRAVCGTELRFDPSMRTCADYDLWLRISHLPVARAAFVVGGTRLSEKSMTRRADRYDRFCVDKIAALKRYLAQFEQSPVLDAVRRRATAGVYRWAASSVRAIEDGDTPQVEMYLARARKLDPFTDV